MPILLALVLFAGPSLANTNDPLKKPEVWHAIVKNPYDSALWACYFGKPWLLMNHADLENIESWRQGIESPKQPAFASLNEEAAFWGAEVADAERRAENKRIEDQTRQAAFMKQVEKAMLEEPPTISELKGNIKVNFFIIEDVYRDLFAEMGVEYVDYATAHPNGKFSQETWLNEKSSQLQALKKEALERKKAQMQQPKTIGW